MSSIKTDVKKKSSARTEGRVLTPPHLAPRIAHARPRAFRPRLKHEYNNVSPATSQTYTFPAYFGAVPALNQQRAGRC